MNILEQILNYFPPIDNYNKDLIDEYYTAYKIKISPYKTNLIIQLNILINFII